MPKLALEKLSYLIKNKRGNRGLREIAAEINISAATLSRIEAGKEPSLDSFGKICIWLRINPGEFLGYSQAQKIPISSKVKLSKPIPINLEKTAQGLGRLILAIHRASML